MSELTQLRDARIVAITDATASMLGTLDNASECLAAETMDKDEFIRVTLQAHARLAALWEQAWAPERAASATADRIRAAGATAERSVALAGRILATVIERPCGCRTEAGVFMPCGDHAPGGDHV